MPESPSKPFERPPHRILLPFPTSPPALCRTLTPVCSTLKSLSPNLRSVWLFLSENFSKNSQNWVHSDLTIALKSFSFFFHQHRLRCIFSVHPTIGSPSTPLYPNDQTPITDQTYGTKEDPRRFEVQHCPSCGLSDVFYCSVFYTFYWLPGIFPQNALLIMYTPLTTFFTHAPIDTLRLLFEQHPPVSVGSKTTGISSDIFTIIPIKCTDGTLPPWFWLVY